MNVNTLIQTAWRNSTLIDEEEEPTAAEAASGLRLLNSLLRTMNIRSWWPWTRTEIQFKLSGQSEYTIGNKDVDEGAITNSDPSFIYVTVPNTSKYQVGDIVNYRNKLVPQVANDDLANNFSAEVITITDATNLVLDNATSAPVDDQDIYIIAKGVLPDIITFRPSKLSTCKYQSGNTWVPLKEVTLSTYDTQCETSNSGSTPYQYRFLPNAPYSILDFTSPTAAGYTAYLGYKSKVDEVEYSTELEDIFPPEYISALEYMLAAKILGVNNRTEPQAIFAESAARTLELKRNNIDVPELDTRPRKGFYDYKAGMNRY